MKIEKLWGNEWLEARQADDWYSYFHHVNGDGVAVLGFRLDPGNPLAKQYLLRKEKTIAHQEDFKMTSLTGTIDEGESPEQAAVRELQEESGYEIEARELIFLGWVWPLKSSDYRQFLYAVDLTGKKQGDIQGDGTLGEEGADVEWAFLQAALEVSDPSVSASIARLNFYRGF